MSVKTNFDAWALTLWLVTILTVLALMSGCGEHKYTTELGIRVTVDPGAGDPGPEYVDRAWMLVAASLSDLGTEPEEALRVRFTLGPIEDCVAGLAAGCYRGYLMEAQVSRGSWDPCTADALAHELVHHWEHMTGRPGDHSAWWFTEILPKIEEAQYAGCEFELHR